MMNDMNREIRKHKDGAYHRAAFEKLGCLYCPFAPKDCDPQKINDGYYCPVEKDVVTYQELDEFIEKDNSRPAR